VKVRARQTYDSSRTPRAGEVRPEPRQVAPVDLEALGKEIAATAERAKENDPAELRRRITQLEREIARKDVRPAEKVVETVVERVPVEVPVLADDQLELLVETARTIGDLTRSLGAIADQVSEAAATVARESNRLRSEQREQREPRRRYTGEPARAGDAVRRAPARPAAPSADLGDADPQLKAGARRILETLARHHPMRVTRAQLGTLAKFKVTGGTFQTYFSQLKRLELIEERDGLIALTDYGLDYVGHVPQEPLTTEELLDQWRSALKAGARQMLDLLVAERGSWIGKDELADRVGMTATGGTFQTYLSTLRRNGLADVSGGEVRASDTLFIGAEAHR
jgi:uncharacterized protein